MVTEAETETEINEVITANLNKGSLFNNLPEIDTTDIMVSNIQEPVYQYPTPPTLELPDSPTPPTSYVPPAFPTSPDLAIPDPPELAELTNLVIPNYNFVPYDASCPELDIYVPKAPEKYSESIHDIDKLLEVREKLLGDIRNGGYGIETKDEEALASRATDRVDRDTKRAIEDTIHSYAKLGFEYPQGELQDSIEQVREEGIRQKATTSKEVYIKRAELYNQNRQFAIMQLHDVEKSLIQLYIANEERRLNSAKLALEQELGLFQSNVEYNKLMMEKYALLQSEYKTKLEGVTHYMQQYDLQIKNKGLEIENNRAKVEEYKGRIEAELAQVNIYKVQMEGAKIHAEVENARIQVYESQVRAYVAVVQAKSTEMQLYEAQMRGEVAKVEVYKARLEADRTRADVIRINAEVLLTKYQTLMEEAKVKIEAYKAQIQHDQVRNDFVVKSAGVSMDIDKLNTDIKETNNRIAVIKDELELKREQVREEILYTREKASALKIGTQIENIQKLTSLAINVM